jgi:hypothetical protein
MVTGVEASVRKVTEPEPELMEPESTELVLAVRVMEEAGAPEVAMVPALLMAAEAAVRVKEPEVAMVVEAAMEISAAEVEAETEPEPGFKLMVPPEANVRD